MNTAVLALALIAPAAPPAKAPDVSGTVQNGLKWLADKQDKDGGWPSMNNAPPTPIVAWAGLAFLMEGSTLKTGTYAPNLRNALAWLEKNSADTGKLGGASPAESYQYMHGHAYAMLFLSGVSDVDDDTDRVKRVSKLMDRAIAFAAECQTTRGGWGFVSAKDGLDYDDSNSTANMLQALFAARKAGFNVPQKTLDRGVDYLVKATNRDGGVIYSTYGGAVPMGNDGQPLSTSSAAAGLLMSDGTRPGALPKWVKSASAANPQLLQYIRNGGSYAMLQQFHMARVHFALGEDGHRKLDPDARDADFVKWSTYRAKAFKLFKESQDKDGSWADQNFGPAYTTAVTLVVLQLDNQYLPAFAR